MQKSFIKIRISLINTHTALFHRYTSLSSSSSPSSCSCLSPLSSSLAFKKGGLVVLPQSCFSTCIFPTMISDNGNVNILRNRLSPLPPMDDSPSSSDGLNHHHGLHSSDGRFRKWLDNVSVRKWRFSDLGWVLRNHPIPCIFACSLVFFLFVEYTLRMVPPTSPPLDLGFIATRPLNRFLSTRPTLNNILAALNTVFVGMEITYILWTLLIEGRARVVISAMFMFTCRGVLGYSTQLPLPAEYLGSGADFPVANMSFFLFYSGHVASAVISSLDMRRMQRRGLAWTFDALNVLQIVRLLATRGHYTIDLGVGIGAGILYDSLAGKYANSSAAYAPLEEREKMADVNV